MANWHEGAIKVSVVCITYNHEKYITEAINSFLMQETDFPFEILIHDDASTDATQEVLLKYQEKYPNIIRLILQEENQRSKGNFRPVPYTARNARGKFVAVCEGDDKWIDKKKLAIQYAAMAAHPNINLCFHPTIYFDKGNTPLGVANRYSNIVQVFEAGEFIRAGGGFCPTASLMVATEVFKGLPDWLNTVSTGDYYIQTIASLSGGGLYLPNVMSAYRWGNSNSATSKTKSLSGVNINTLVQKELEHLAKLESYCGDFVANDILYRKALICQEFSALPLKNGEFRIFRSLINQSWSFTRKINKRQLLLYKFRYFPLVLKLIQTVKQKLKPIPKPFTKLSEDEFILFKQTTS